MKALIISTNQNQLPVPVIPMGACMVAQAAREAGHDAAVLDLMFEPSPLAAVRSAVLLGSPDIIGISARNIDNNSMRDTAFYPEDVRALVRALRGLTDSPVVLGGASVAVMPEEIMRFTGVDMAVTGDGEITFPALLDRLGSGGQPDDLPGVALVKNGAFRRNPLPPAGPGGRCPAPDYGAWLDVRPYLARMATIPLQTKLGCQFDCIYCTYRKIQGRQYRLFDPGSVADAVSGYAARGLRDVEFVDNIFNVPVDHAMAVCEALARGGSRGRLQSIELNPSCITDDLLSAMERAGFVGIGITVESVADPVLEGLRKGFTSREVRHAAEVVRRHRLPCTWIFLLGGPGETIRTARETIAFAEREIRPRDTAFFNTGLRIYPATGLEAVARREGLLDPDVPMLEPVFYLSPQVDVRGLQELVRDAMSRRMNFLSSGSIGMGYLPKLHRWARRLGLAPPLWRYTPVIRRALRALVIPAGEGV